MVKKGESARSGSSRKRTKPDDGVVPQWSEKQRQEYDALHGKGANVQNDDSASQRRHFAAKHAIDKARGEASQLTDEQQGWLRGHEEEIAETQKWVTPVHAWVTAKSIQERASPIALRLLREYESMYGTAPVGLLGTLTRGIEEGMQCAAEIELATEKVRKRK